MSLTLTRPQICAIELKHIQSCSESNSVSELRDYDSNLNLLGLGNQIVNVFELRILNFKIKTFRLQI